jgi:eukaryotic-like serine/threonine-protein kinase
MLGDRVGRYVPLRVIGRGGTGIVIAAHDPELDRQVAIKLVHPQVWRVASPEERDLLRQEARAMARLVHPNVVAVHDLGTVGEQLFVAMELVTGTPLDAWLEAKPRAWREVLAVCRGAGRGLSAAHRAGLVHRAIKASNVIVDEHDHPRIADFGLVMLRTDGVATPASDQLDFCVMVDEALSGRGGVPRSVRRALVRGMSRDPDDRFASMDALLPALEPRPIGRWAIGGALVVAAAGAGAAVMLVAGGESPAAAAKRAAAARAAAVWSAVSHREVRDGLMRDGAAFAAETGDRVIGGLDRYVAGWVAVRIDVARAARAGEQSASALAWRMGCLDRRLDEVRALVSVLRTGGAGVTARAIDGVGALTPPRVCVERDLAAMRPPPEEPARRARHAELLRVLADVGAHLRVGRHRDAATLAEQLVADARALADPPLLAEALQIHSLALASTGETDRSVALLRETVLAAAAAGDPRIEARAWCDLVTTTVNAGRGKPPDEVIMAARAAVARVTDAPEIELAFAQAQAMVAIAEGRHADAETHWRKAQALAAVALPADHPRQAQTRLGIATSLGEQHRYADALAMVDEARTVALRIYGPHHPDLAPYWANTAVMLSEHGQWEPMLLAADELMKIAAPGSVYAGLGPLYKANALMVLNRPNEGVPLMKAAVETFRAAGNHAQEFQALVSMAVMQYGESDKAGAGETITRAVEVGRRAFGEQGPPLIYPLTLLGVIAGDRGDLAAALRHCREAIAIGTAAWGEGDGSLAMAATCLSRAQRLQGHPQAALSDAERAVTLSDRSPQINDQTEARLELARVLVALRADRARIRRVVEEVLAREQDPPAADTVRAEFAAVLAR